MHGLDCVCVSWKPEHCFDTALGEWGILLHAHDVHCHDAYYIRIHDVFFLTSNVPQAVCWIVSRILLATQCPARILFTNGLYTLLPSGVYNLYTPQLQGITNTYYIFPLPVLSTAIVYNYMHYVFLFIGFYNAPHAGCVLNGVTYSVGDPMPFDNPCHAPW